MVKTIYLANKEGEFDLWDNLMRFPRIWKKGNVNINFHPFNSTEPDPRKIKKEDRDACRLTMGFFIMKDDITPKLQTIINKDLKGVEFVSGNDTTYLVSVMELTKDEFYIELGIDERIATLLLYNYWWSDKVMHSLSVTNLLPNRPETFKIDSEADRKKGASLLINNHIRNFNEYKSYEVVYRCISKHI